MEHIIFRGIPLFQGIEDEEIDTLLHCVDTSTQKYAKDEYLYHRGEHIDRMGLIISGRVSLEQEDLWGNRRVQAVIGPGSLFAEGYAGREEVLTFNIRAEQESTVLYLNMERLLSICSSACPYHLTLIHNFVEILTEKNRLLSQKINLLTRKTLRERILTYLDEEAKRQNSCQILVPLTRQQLAEHVSADRSALSSELSRMQQEGLIHYTRNYFELITKKQE